MTSACLLGTSAQGTQGTTPLPHLYRAPASSSWTRSPVGVVAEAVHPLGGGGSPVPDGAGRHSRLPDGGPAGHAAGHDDDQAAAPLNLPVRRHDQRVPPGRAADLMKHLVRHHAMSSEGVHGTDTDDLPYPSFSQQRSVI